eukprot:989242-Amphidinium_carterae.2
MVTGIFLGYWLNPGGKWKGDYLCISLADLRDGNLQAVQRVGRVIPPVSKIYRFPLAEERDPYSEQWRLSHGLLGTETNGTNLAQKFPHKDDTKKRGGTEEDDESGYERRDKVPARDRRDFTSTDDIPPVPRSSEEGGRREVNIDEESTNVQPPMSSAGSPSGERAPLEGDRAPDRDERKSNREKPQWHGLNKQERNRRIISSKAINHPGGPQIGTSIKEGNRGDHYGTVQINGKYIP